jgi:hypothetical protein
MWSLGMDGGAARRNWAIPVGDSAGGGVEKEEELTLNRFVASDGGEITGGWPAGGAQGALSRRPRSGGAPAWEGARWCWEGWGGRVGLLGRLAGGGMVGVPKLAGGLQGQQLRRACTGQQAAPACAGQQRPK